MRRSAILLPNPLKPTAHSGIGVGHYYAMHFMGAMFPLGAGVLLYGWRAAWSVALVLLAAGFAVVVWRRVGTRGHELRLNQAAWFATLLALMLPAHLVTTRVGIAPPYAAGWPLLVAAGVMLVILLWSVGGIGAGRIHPVLITYLLLSVLFSEELAPRCSLQRHRIITGDLLDCAPSHADAGSPEPWVRRPVVRGFDAVSAPSVVDRLIAYTRGAERSERGLLRLQGLLSERLPPLEDLVVGGQPAPTGTGSAVAVIVGGLFLLYRGLIDPRVPLIIVGCAYVSLLVLPIPARIVGDWPQWSWLVVREADVDWATALTFVHYEIMASPLLFAALFLATAPSIRPVTRKARVVYSVVAGMLSAPAMLYVSVSMGPYLAVFAASLLTPLLDRWLSPKPLV
jgi:Na+-translocating ferredoxin:NAD+ oxidoreductase RnfD subunit